MNRRTLLSASASLIGVGCTGRTIAAPPGAPHDATPHPWLDEIRIDAGIPALGGAVVTADGLSWIGVSGRRRAGGEAAVTVSDRWHLGSNTKAMTAALYARLVEQGRAHWQASVPTLFADLDVDPAWAGITIEHLLGHRSGVLDARFMPLWMIQAFAGNDLQALRSTLAGSVLGSAPAGSVGDFAYSNVGYIIAGAAIERITGEPWEDAIRREIFAPLGMASAGFGAPTGNNAWGHRGLGLGPVDPTGGFADNPPALGPAGTVHASIEDYGRFLRVFLTDGGGWLSPESLARLTTPLAGEGLAYALGWAIVAGPGWAGDEPAMTHDGSNTMWLARTIVAPGRNAALICVANAADPAQSAVDGLTRTLIERFPV